MASNILSTLLPSYAVDYVAVFDQDYNQVFRSAKAIKAVVKEQAKVMEHPVETGAIITDHRIILPVEIQLSLILTSDDYQDVYKVIRQFYLNGTLLVVQTKSGIYDNQLIQSMPHEEDPTQFDILTLALTLKQVQFVTAQFVIAPKHPRNNTTVKRGSQNPTPTSKENTSAAYDGLSGLINGVKSLFKGF